MKRIHAMYHILIVLLTLTTFNSSAVAKNSLEKRWLYLSTNLYVDNVMDNLTSILQRAHKAGYNGILFTDYKTFTWWQLDAKRWEKNALALRQLCKDLNMEFTVCVMPFGYAGSLLWHDPNLASGLPIKNAPLIAKDNSLVPQQTAIIKNGSFEEYTNHTAKSYAFQDAPGTGSFIDTEIKHNGNASLRFEDVGKQGGYVNARICQKVTVLPYQHYRIRVWMKADHLTTDEMKILVIGDGRVLQHEFLNIQHGDKRDYFNRMNDVTFDWTEVIVSFNSLENEMVNIYVGQWGGKTGKIWIDDLRIESVPAFNILRRNSLPLTLTDKDGNTFTEGKDFEPITDPKLGNTPWPGSYESYHDQPSIKLTANSKIKPGQTVYLSAWHPVLVYGGQVNCSLSDPKVFALCREQITRLDNLLHPDGYFMSHDEIRAGGWEPDQLKRFKTTGDLLSWNIKQCTDILHEIAPNRPIYTWSDMFDPHHNAIDRYYLMNSSLENSWQNLDPSVIIAKWGQGDRSPDSMKFFANRGHKQLIACFYDHNPKDDYTRWQDISKDIDNVLGVIYTTWSKDYSQLETFADLWWNKTNK